MLLPAVLLATLALVDSAPHQEAVSKLLVLAALVAAVRSVPSW